MIARGRGTCRRALGAMAVLVVAAVLGVAPAAASGQRCQVVGADDAATLRLRCGVEPRLLRLAAVRAPRPGTPLEGGEPYGTQGRDLVRGWFVGRLVEVGGGTARLGGEDVRRGLLALGLVEWTGGATVEGDAALRAAEREARLAARGLWSYAAWRRHQSSVRQPLLIPGIPPPPAEESLGAAAARLSSRSAAERRAAFEAAVAQLEARRRAQPEAPPKRPPARDGQR